MMLDHDSHGLLHQCSTKDIKSIAKDVAWDNNRYITNVIYKTFFRITER